VFAVFVFRKAISYIIGKLQYMVVLRKNPIWLPSDRDVGTCFFGFPSLENLGS